MKGIKCEVSVMGMGDRCTRREGFRRRIAGTTLAMSHQWCFCRFLHQMTWEEKIRYGQGWVSKNFFKKKKEAKTGEEVSDSKAREILKTRGLSG